MANYRAPGVYVEEIPFFPPSVEEVASAVPAFVGYTEKATAKTPGDLSGVPTPIQSWHDYLSWFGGPDREDPTHIDIRVDEQKSGTTTTGFKVSIQPDHVNLSRHIFYHAVRHYFANGGGTCYIVSVGDYSKPVTNADIATGLGVVAAIDEPTMIVVPEAIALDPAGYRNIIQQMIIQASFLKERFAIIDTALTTVPKTVESIANDVRTAIDHLPVENSVRSYGAVYYPFLETTYTYEFDFDTLKLSEHRLNGGTPIDDKTGRSMLELRSSSAAMYNGVFAEFAKHHITLPPSAAVAGVYARVDRERGVWKAPANVGMLDVVKPIVPLSLTDQERLSINTETGRSVNAIVSLTGKGTVVMGARTLDGNDNEWRYINVRRFFMVTEASLKKSTGWVVFEPNTVSTWLKVRAMIENYLELKWRQGALAGAKPEQAFFVNVGLGKTMTPEDILEGRLIVELGMAVVRPAEFIILRLTQKMQAS